MTSIQVIEILNATSLVSCTFLHAMIISSFNALGIAWEESESEVKILFSIVHV